MIILLASIALAALPTPERLGKCSQITEISIADDTAHTVWETHREDVAAYHAEHHFELKDYQPLVVEARTGGTACIDFGTLRPFRDAIRGNIGVAVYINGIYTPGSVGLQTHTSFNAFTVIGLKSDTVVTVEFLRGGLPKIGACTRTEDPRSTTWSNGVPIPNTTYTCPATSPVQLNVIEHREYTTDVNWRPAPLPQAPAKDIY